MDIDVKHIAKLARLKIEDDEVEQMTKEMQAVVTMVENLPPLESEDSLLEKDNFMILREDIALASSPREEVLQNAPQTADGCFLVPRTVE